MRLPACDRGAGGVAAAVGADLRCGRRTGGGLFSFTPRRLPPALVGGRSRAGSGAMLIDRRFGRVPGGGRVAR
jgi:hypothetical protein